MCMKASILFFTCFMNIIPFFPDDPADTGIFCKCVRYLVAAILRKIPVFEKKFYYTFRVNNSSNMYLNICQKKIGVIFVFGPMIAV